METHQTIVCDADTTNSVCYLYSCPLGKTLQQAEGIVVIPILYEAALNKASRMEIAKKWEKQSHQGVLLLAPGLTSAAVGDETLAIFPLYF